MLQKELEEAKRDIEKGKDTINSKDKTEEELRGEIKKNKEDYLKL